MKIRSIDVGRTVMVRYNEGRVEGLMVELRKDSKPVPDARVFFPINHKLCTVSLDQITEIGPRIDLCPIKNN